MSDVKKKKNVFKFFARLNSKNKNPKNPEKPKSPKKQRNWIFGLSAAGLAVIAGGLAIGFTTNSTYFVGTLDPSVIAYVVSKGEGKELKITVGDVIGAAKGFFNEDDGELAMAKRELALHLYQEEHEASKVFQRAWDSSKKEGEDSRTFEIDSLDEVRLKQKNNLEDKKRSIQKTFSVQNWENEWKKELAKPEFGTSASEEQAIEYLTLNSIRAQAFARWIPKMDDTFTKYDVEERVAKEDIDTTDKDGNKIIVYPKGERIFKAFLNTNNTTDKSEDINGFLPDVPGHNLTSTTKVNAFLTKSFLPEFAKTDSLMKTYLDQFGYAFNVSELVINATQDAGNATLPWKISKNDLVELLTYKVLSFSNSQSALGIKQNIELILGFKGSTNITEEGKEDDLLLLNSINSGTNAVNHLGAKPLRNIFEVFKDEDTSYANGHLEGTFQVVEKPNLFNDILEKLREALFKGDKNIILPNSESLIGKNASEIEEINTVLQKEINKKSDTEIAELAGGAFRDLFATSITDRRVQTIYKIADEKYALLSQKGIHYVLMNKISTVEQFRKLVAQQVQLKANEQFDSKQKPTTDVVKTFSFFNSEDQIFATMIKQKEVQTKIVDKLLEKGTAEEKEKLIQNLLRQGTQIEVTYFLNRALESFTKIETYVKNVVDNNLNSDYVYDAEVGEFIIRGDATKQPAAALLFKQLKNKGVKA